MIVSEWLSNVPLVLKVLHPGHKSHPDYKIFTKDYKLGAGLFAFELKTKDLEKVDRFIDNLNLFGIGASWGGFESLVLEADLEQIRDHKTFKDGTLIRLAIGLEDPNDLINDLSLAFEQIS